MDLRIAKRVIIDDQRAAGVGAHAPEREILEHVAANFTTAGLNQAALGDLKFEAYYLFLVTARERMRRMKELFEPPA